MLRTIVVAVLLASQASAAEGPRLGTQGDHARPKPECMCRLRSGERVPLGTYTCLRVGGREYLAQCRLSQNVSTWREVEKGCPVS